MIFVQNIITNYFVQPCHKIKEQLSDSRTRKAAYTTITMSSFRACNIIFGLITIPITLRYLGEERFGIWMILTSVIGALSFYDFGLGIGLRNQLIKCFAEDNREKASEYVFNALIVISILALLLIIMILSCSPFLPLENLIKCSNRTIAEESRVTIITLGVVFAFGLPVNQCLNILSAYQEVYIGYLFLLFGRLCSFVFIFLAIYLDFSFPVFAGSYLAIPFIFLAICFVVLGKMRPWLFHWHFRLNFKYLHDLFSTGVFVMLHHLSYALCFTSILIIIGNLLGGESGGQYSIVQKLLSMATLLGTSMLLGIALPVGEAWFKGDLAWIRSSIKKTWTILFLSSILPLVALMIFARPIIRFWTGTDNMAPSVIYLFICTLTIAFSLLGDIYANSLMAMDYVKTVALTRFFAGVTICGIGYLLTAQLLSPLPLLICQLVFGALFPWIFWGIKFRNMLNKKETLNTRKNNCKNENQAPADHLLV